MSDVAAANSLDNCEQTVLFLSPLLNVSSDGDDVTVAGKLFHTGAAATGKAQSPTVDKCVEGTLSASVKMNGDAADRRGPRHAGDHWRDTAGLSQEGRDRQALPACIQSAASSSASGVHEVTASRGHISVTKRLAVRRRSSRTAVYLTDN